MLELTERTIAHGDLIRFPEPMQFTDGSRHADFKVRREGRKLTLTLPDGRGRFKISRLLERRFEIIRQPKVARTFFPAA